MALFRFNDVYLLTTPPGDLKGMDFVVGIRELGDQPNPEMDNKPQPRFQWISVTESGMGGHDVQGIVLREGRDLVEIQVTSFTDWKASPPIVFRFEPLTYERWLELGKAGWLREFDSYVQRITNEAEMKNYYMGVHLPDWWTETPE